MSITYNQVSIQIISSNCETRKAGVVEGDSFVGEREFVNDEPTQKVWFDIGDEICIAYLISNDDHSDEVVTTCKLLQ